MTSRAFKNRDRQYRRWFANFVLCLCSLVVSVLLTEMGIRILAPQHMSGVVFEYAPRGYSVIKSEATALYSVGDRKGIYHFMPHHLRGVSTPTAGATRILVLGDSFTFGVGLDDEDTYVALLQKKLDTAFGAGQFVLLNAGIPGSGSAEHLAFLEDFAAEIEPRAVIIFISIDDFDRASRSPLYRLSEQAVLSLDEGNAPKSMLKELVTESRIYNFLIQHAHVAQLIRRFIIDKLYSPNRKLASVGAPGSNSESGAEQKRLVRALFRRMKAWCDSHDIRFAVINNGWQSYDWLPDLLRSENIVVFDAAPRVQPAIRLDMTSYAIPEDGHPNPKGAELIADAVWPFLQSFVNESGLRRSPHPG
jgi:lysophospholipase L1-like esterase